MAGHGSLDAGTVGGVAKLCGECLKFTVKGMEPGAGGLEGTE